MEQERFDELARGLAAGRSRRGIVRNLAGVALGGTLAAIGVGEAGARKRRKQGRPSPDGPVDDKTRRRKKKHPCPAGQTRCRVGGARHGKHKKACVDLQTDHRHCGACDHACPSDQTCQAGECRGGGDCTADCRGKQCGSNGCGGNCGTCPTSASCQQGQCVADECSGGCGSHGSCKNGTCACDAGYQTCDAASPCAIDTQTDAANCGACGNVCPARTGAHAPGCSAGTCTLICDAGWADCNNNANDGCETPLGTPNDCLQCGDSCAHFADECNAPVCGAGGCGATPTNEGGSCQGGGGTCSNGACVPANTCIEALQPCVDGGVACCEGRVCQAFSPGCWGPRYCCRASGEPCTNACDCCSATCAGPWINGVGTCP